MACALCTSNAPRPVAFPPRLIGSCPSNRTPSAKLTSFFVTTVLEPSDPPLDKTKMPKTAGFRLYCSLTW